MHATRAFVRSFRSDAHLVTHLPGIARQCERGAAETLAQSLTNARLMCIWQKVGASHATGP